MVVCLVVSMIVVVLFSPISFIDLSILISSIYGEESSYTKTVSLSDASFIALSIVV